MGTDHHTTVFLLNSENEKRPHSSNLILFKLGGKGKKKKTLYQVLYIIRTAVYLFGAVNSITLT